MPRWLQLGTVAFLGLFARQALAEDGYDLWLRYRPLSTERAQDVGPFVREIVASDSTSTCTVTRAELVRAIGAMLGSAPALSDAVSADGAIVVGTPASSPAIAGLKLDLAKLGRDGYAIRSVSIAGHATIVVAANADIGALYGTFHLLRLIQTGQSLQRLDVREAPRLKLRVLDHWDNLDGHVERGYAGSSIWDWHKLPDWLDPRYTDYARANASLGINGAVLNNVAADALILTPPYLEKVSSLAGIFRPYGIRVYLSARFSAPIELGELKTADPLDAAVQRWWRDKADEVYKYIPDFGGFLVKANSEGQPGPQDYGRNHADGANMLADALAPHGGVVMWRAFVYAAEQGDDRAKQAYAQFTPLDGRFRANVLVQVKNGPIDFQPREPFHPLFGAMPKTPLMLEFQITKEYLGFATHLAYLGPLYEETLQSDTHRPGKDFSVANIVEGTRDGGPSGRLSGMAGVANIGTDRNWSGSVFDQANWYAFGRLAWNPTDPARVIAADWVRMTFTNDAAFVAPVVDMMMGSREAVVDYMTPLGLAHQMAHGHHYGPAPWDASGARADQTPVYFHRADRNGIGFDRSVAGSNAVAQYAPPLAKEFGDAKTVPERYLLWFHHVPWDYRTRSGRTLWDELVHRYTRGVDEVKKMRETWRGLEGFIDPERYRRIAAFLAIQQYEAQWWRDASIAYYQSVSGLPLPAGYAAPAHPRAWYESLTFPYAPGQGK